MKKSLFFVPLFAAALVSCSSDEPSGDVTTPDDANGIYATIKFSSVTSRAGSSDGIEEGKDYENKVSSILVVLATGEGATDDSDPTSYKFLASAYEGNPKVTGSTYTICFTNKIALYEYANETGDDKPVYVFAYCNPTEEIKATANSLTANSDLTDFLNSAFKSTDDEQLAATWKKEGFLMTNHDIHKSLLPNQTKLNECSTPEKAYALTPSSKPLEVMRTAVRFDFRDASNYTPAGSSEKTPLTYSIKDVTDNTKVQGTVTLTRAALFNMRDEFYYLPRTSVDNKVTLCPGAIKDSHWDYPGLMVTPANPAFTYSLPFVAASTGTETSAVYSFDPTSADFNLKWDSLSAVLGYEEDTDNDWNADAEADKLGYHIWRYSTENAFPVNETTFSPNEATGVVFEAEINLTPANDTDPKPDGTNPMFLYNGTMYANAQQICQAALNNQASQIYTDVMAVFDITKNENGELTSATLKSEISSKKLLFSNNINIYWPKDGKYYCYYYYFNRHNNNDNPAITAVDEFAAIRNNVYKLAVTSIKMFGTFVPSNKIEDWDVYFTVDVQVLPWTVRVNNIDF